jgi:hypothetical protein
MIRIVFGITFLKRNGNIPLPQEFHSESMEKFMGFIKSLLKLNYLLFLFLIM